MGLRGGVNVYAYANADPTDLRDPSGLIPGEASQGLGKSPGTRPSTQRGAVSPDGTSIDPAASKLRIYLTMICNLLTSDPNSKVYQWSPEPVEIIEPKFVPNPTRSAISDGLNP